VAAVVTSRIKIGPATLLLPLRHPTMVAKEFASLDIYSKGRVILTVGVGGEYPREFHACGIPMEERGRRGTEAIEIIKKYWAGGRFSYHGKIFHLEDVDMLPLPVQQGGPPIWVSGRSEAAMRRAAWLGDGYHPYMFDANQCRDSFRKVRVFAREMGRPLSHDYVFAVFQYVSLFDDPAEGRRRAIHELKYRYDQEFEHLVDRYCTYGPPDVIIEGLRKYVEAGTSYFILAPILDPERRREGLERYAKEVLPALRKMTPPRVL
jgi:alkanesulfonate monooxygenase SsuD/methylene tetrahydromethanopterin reductase-like flavin-dependent oxidoreductase (luciferase family)